MPKKENVVVDDGCWDHFLSTLLKNPEIILDTKILNPILHMLEEDNYNKEIIILSALTEIFTRDSLGSDSSKFSDNLKNLHEASTSAHALDIYSRILLHFAIDKNNIKAIDIAHKQGISMDAPWENTEKESHLFFENPPLLHAQTPLFTAIINYNLPAMEILLKYGARLDITVHAPKIPDEKDNKYASINATLPKPVTPLQFAKLLLELLPLDSNENDEVKNLNKIITYLKSNQK